jgi:hypothetical protein
MAHRSRPKNFSVGHEFVARPHQHNMGGDKPAPGYSGQGPALPGHAYGPAGTPRQPPNAEKYYPEWSSSNIKSNQVAKHYRLYGIIRIFGCLCYDTQVEN